MCGGKKKPGTTVYSVDLGAGIIVVRDVPAMLCIQCGEEWIDTGTARMLEQYTEEARQKKRQVEIISMMDETVKS